MVRSAAATSLPAMIKPALKAMLLVLWIAVFFLPVLALHRLQRIDFRDRLVRLCHGGILAIVGLRVRVVGGISPQRPLLLVSNHLSYLDVPVLAAQMPVCFTPKAEIGRWPVIGEICRMTGCIFITRSSTALAEASQAMSEALAGGRVVCLYPEATTGNGMETLPFRSSFFAMAEKPLGSAALMVQPVAICYRTLRGLPIDRTQWPEIAWYGDMELLPHLWNLLKLGHMQADLVFLEPVTMTQFSDRKAMAEHCRSVIVSALHSPDSCLPQR